MSGLRSYSPPKVERIWGMWVTAVKSLGAIPQIHAATRFSLDELAAYDIIHALDQVLTELKGTVQYPVSCHENSQSDGM